MASAADIKCLPTSKAPQTKAAVKGISYVGSSIANADFDTSAAEIVSYDSCTDKLFVVNAKSQRVDVLGFDSQTQPKHERAIDLSKAGTEAGIEIGAANSVSTYKGIVAVAIENKVKQKEGVIALYRADTLDLLKTFPAGALPDMVSISNDGRYIASANEGEPNSDYSVDPRGSITLVDISKGIDQAEVTQIGFEDFNHGQARQHELPSEVRISGPNASVAQDLEPEYLTFAGNGKLFVSLQENNALAKIDLPTARVEAIYPLKGKSWSQSELDASNKDGIAGNLKAYPKLEGLYMPDSIASATINGQQYVLTANEGDGREYGYQTTQLLCDEKGHSWDGDDYSNSPQYKTEQDFCIVYSDELRGKKLKVDADHPLAQALKDNKALARLKVIAPQNQLSKDDTVYAFGARSFSIWNDKGEQVFDSGDEFARIVLSLGSDNFNSSNDSNLSGDDRSDDKGVEPEAIEVANIHGATYAFIGLERQGGIMTYDISDPAKAKFVHYLNSREFTQPVCTQVNGDGECESDQFNPSAGDLGPESIHHFVRNNQHFIAVGNEVSGTTTIYKVDI
ncbi:choice-of-anchor I family protein [Vibrio sonorensis]|uniref:choice-of-anchor I family protein n=1 Tax=Vibrio sonorensis TaxID=1004316 RepID=UPI0011133A9E|nr:choice-of-anchor I family protein [Vibrio sonorensis]